ncbi:uncharacterized protein ACWYII_034694, partial [Salvelinus alpinus]
LSSLSLSSSSSLPSSDSLPPLLSPSCPSPIVSRPLHRLEQYCDVLEELGGLNHASESFLSVLRHAQCHGEDLRASDLIVGCPVPVAERESWCVRCVGGPGGRRPGCVPLSTPHHLDQAEEPGTHTYSFKHSTKCQSGEERAAWTHDITQLLWTHTIHNTGTTSKPCFTLSVTLLS